MEPSQDGERSLVVRRKSEVQLVEVAHPIPGSLHPAHTALSLASNILTDTLNGRLHQQLVESGQPVGVYAGGLDALAPGLSKFGAVVKKAAPLEPVRNARIATVERFYTTPPMTGLQPSTILPLQRPRICSALRPLCAKNSSECVSKASVLKRSLAPNPP